MTVCQLAGRYHVGKTLWGEYRTGQKIIPLELLRRLVRDHTPDERTRETRLETAERLHAGPRGTPHAPVDHRTRTGAGPRHGPGTRSSDRARTGRGRTPSLDPHRRRNRDRASRAARAAARVASPGERGQHRRGPGTPDAGGATTVLPASTEVFTIAPGGRGIFQWDGENAAGWTKIGDSARQLWAGSAGLFATGMDNKLYLYEGRPGRWHPISEPGADFAVAGSHLYRLAADRQSIHIWNGWGTSERIGGSAARLYGGELGLFAIALKDGSIFRYRAAPTSGLSPARRAPRSHSPGNTCTASSRTAPRSLSGWTNNREWPGSTRRARPATSTEASPAFSPPTRRRSGSASSWHWGPTRRTRAGRTSAQRARRCESADEMCTSWSKRSLEILCWSRDTGTWRRIGGPAQTLAVRPTPSTSTIR